MNQKQFRIFVRALFVAMFHTDFGEEERSGPTVYATAQVDIFGIKKKTLVKNSDFTKSLF